MAVGGEAVGGTARRERTPGGDAGRSSFVWDEAAVEH
jgi:hypothetical protein